MKKHIIISVMACTALSASPVFAAPGEYWEITNKMEMVGMPFSMPETTTKVCMPAGSENDPRVAASGPDDKCEMTDIKTVGSTTTWKMRCDNDGEIMTGSGEITHTGTSYQGNTHLEGKMDGEMVKMNQVYRGKKIGGSCDTETPHPLAAQAQKQIDESCTLESYTGADLVYSADLFLGQAPLCTDKKGQYCAKLRNELTGNSETYHAAAMYEGTRAPGSTLSALCSIDLEAARQNLCRKNSDDFSFLEQHCPAEAKAYLEAERQKEMSQKNLTGRASTSRPPAQGGGAGTVLDGAKKLKGIFGL